MNDKQMSNIQIEKALKIALECHTCQVDKGGDAYILHPLTVMQIVDGGADYKVVAILHDVIEDSNIYTINDLEYILRLSEKQKQALWLLTNLGCEDYQDYINRIACSGNDIAIKVKIADLIHNSDRTRPGFSQDRLKIYEKAMQRLLRVK